jgi:hypothetical protein
MIVATADPPNQHPKVTGLAIWRRNLSKHILQGQPARIVCHRQTFPWWKVLIGLLTGTM